MSSATGGVIKSPAAAVAVAPVEGAAAGGAIGGLIELDCRLGPVGLRSIGVAAAEAAAFTGVAATVVCDSDAFGATWESAARHC